MKHTLETVDPALASDHGQSSLLPVFDPRKKSKPGSTFEALHCASSFWRPALGDCTHRDPPARRHRHAVPAEASVAALAFAHSGTRQRDWAADSDQDSATQRSNRLFSTVRTYSPQPRRGTFTIYTGGKWGSVQAYILHTACSILFSSPHCFLT